MHEPKPKLPANNPPKFESEVRSEAEHAEDTPTVSEEAARRRAREFDDALYASLTSRAHSDQARELVETVTGVVAAHELGAGTRVKKRNKKQVDLRSAVERFLSDLLQAQSIVKTHGYVYRNVRPQSFTDNKVGYRTFKRLIDALVHLELLESYRGFQNLRDLFGAPVPMIRKATRFRATQKLLDICDRHGVRAADFHQHFLIPLPDNPLQLRATSRRSEYGDKIRGKPMRFEPTALTERLERQLKELNAFFGTFELRGGIHRGYLRVFNNGDHAEFNWNMGGRLYSYSEGNYQQMDSEGRLRMTINGEAVCEIDIRASYLTIFHALYREPFDATNDPYDVPGLGPEARDVVKMWVTASFGNNAPITKWPKELVAKYRERTGKTLGNRYSASKVGEKVIEKFPLLTRLGEIVEGKQRGWAELMYVESQAIFETMLELMREQIPSLAVHDSIIVPVRARHKATKVLAKHYRDFTKAVPALTTKLPEGHNEQDDPWNL